MQNLIMITNIVLLIWVMRANGGLKLDDGASTSQDRPVTFEDLRSKYSFNNKESLYL